MFSIYSFGTTFLLTTARTACRYVEYTASNLSLVCIDRSTAGAALQRPCRVVLQCVHCTIRRLNEAGLLCPCDCLPTALYAHTYLITPADTVDQSKRPWLGGPTRTNATKLDLPFHGLPI